MASPEVEPITMVLVSGSQLVSGPGPPVKIKNGVDLDTIFE